MAEFTELVQALTWLLTNRIQQKIDYIHGLLGDGNGRVRVSTIPGSPEVDYVFVRPDRFSNRSFKVFNKRIEGQDGDPIIIGELPWEPGLVQVVDMDWAAYADVGWGDDVTTINRHGISHQWRDGAPGIDTFNVYRRQFGDLKTYATVSGTLNVGVSPYSLDLFGKQYQWPGIQDFSLAGALPTATGTARMAMVYWSPASGTTQGHLGIATGTLGGDSEATILNRPVSPQGVIPSAFVRLAGGQSSITEFDIWDAREPFRPGLSFGTGTAGLSADMIPISDVVGFYTGSTVESALAEVPYKLIAPDGGINPVLSADNSGDVTLAGTGDLIVPDLIIHSGDTDTNIAFTDDDIEFTAGALSMLKLTEAGQDLITLGPGSGDVNIDFNGDMFLVGGSGNFGINTEDPTYTEEGSTVSSQVQISRRDAPSERGTTWIAETDTPIRNAQNAFVKARTGPAAVQADDRIGDYIWSGHDGTDFNISARFGGVVDGAVAGNTVPMRIVFDTSQTQSSGLTERMRITSDGRIGINNTGITYVTEGATITPQIIVDRENAGARRAMVFNASSNTAARSPQNEFLRRRTAGAVQSGDSIGDFFFSGHDGTDFNRSAGIGGVVDGAVAGNTVPIALTFDTSETNSSGVAERMRISSSGNVGIGTTSPNAKLEVKEIITSIAVQRVVNTHASGFSGIEYMKKDESTLGAYIGLHSDDTYMRMNSVDKPWAFLGGNVGLNSVTSPSTELDIGAGAIEMDEMSAPGGGAANTVRLYAEDDGGGKTRLMAVFNTGAAQQVAIEP